MGSTEVYNHHHPYPYCTLTPFAPPLFPTTTTPPPPPPLVIHCYLLQFLEEVDREDYEGTFHDYAEAVIQFGYLNLYSVVMPYLGTYHQIATPSLFLYETFSRLIILTINPSTVVFLISPTSLVALLFYRCNQFV